MNSQVFQKKIWNYYRAKKRDLPWRLPSLKLQKGKLDPYKILVSEVMLQQTQVSRVLKKYPEFLKAFPDVRTLAKTPLGNVLRVWQGMGYNRRAIALKRLAEEVVRHHHAKIPLDFESLIALPGVGRSTAGAVMAFVADAPVVFVETNIRRVFLHHFFTPKRHSNVLQNVRTSFGISDMEILRLVEKTLPRKNVREWYWALMDYGAMLGADKMPNPNRRSSHYARQSAFEGSHRQLRGRILNLLVREKILSLQELREKTEVSPAKLEEMLRELAQEGFLVKANARYVLAR